MIALRHSSFLFLLPVLAILFLPPYCAGQADSDQDKLRERFLKEAPRGWSVLEEWDTNIEIRGEFFGPETKMTRQSFHYCRKGERVLAEESGPDYKDPSRVSSGLFALNDDYSFWISKKTSDAPWVVRYLYTEKQEALRAIRLRYLHYTNPHDHSGATKFKDLDKESSFQWTTFEMIQRDGKEYFKASYEKINQYPREPRPTRVGGYLLLDPGNYWACIESSAKLLEKTRHGVATSSMLRVSYANKPVGRIRPFARVEVSYENSEKNKTVFEANYVGPPTVADSAFTLSGYGLPESVVEVPRERPRFWIWLVAIGLVCGIMAVLVRFHRKRGKA